MGNLGAKQSARIDSDITTCEVVNIMNLFEELKADLMDKFEEKDKGTLKKIDTIAFYGDFREILIVDELNKKEEINSLVYSFEKSYSLTDKQKTLINKIISALK